MGNRYEIAEQNGMSREFVDWFFDNKKNGCGNVWFMMMAAMWEGWKGNADMQERQSVGHVDEQSRPGNKKQITSSMAKDIAFKLGAELNDEEADIFADGYNAAILGGGKS
ncbi:hypothetical protein GHU15_08725 [Citrobacter koseri]|nr:hypothetical protein [Citrobacter koseri]